MTAGILGERAIVAGAGIGGLAAAAALSPFFRQVDIIEKDRLAADGRPRKGVAQGFHGHVFLVGGQVSLERLFPGIIDDFRAAGALMADFGSDFNVFDYGMPRPRRQLGLVMACLSRPAYERILQARVGALGNVRIADGMKMAGAALDNGEAVGLVVDGAVERADFTVDASGRGAALSAQLEREGFGRAPEVSIGVNVCYVSARFRLDKKWGSSAPALCIPAPPEDRGFGVVLPIEDGLHIVSIGGRCGLEPPVDLPGYLAFSRTLASRAIAERLEGAELVTPLLRYRKPTSDWRRYDLLESFPRRLAPVGDTIASFNPTFAQGMTVAIRHALALAATLAEAGTGPDFARRYLPAAAAHSEEAWTGAAVIDLAYPEVTGDRPPGFEGMRQFLGGLRRLADADPEVHRLEGEVMHMVRDPSAFEDERLRARVMEMLQSGAAAREEEVQVPNPVAT